MVKDRNITILAKFSSSQALSQQDNLAPCQFGSGSECVQSFWGVYFTLFDVLLKTKTLCYHHDPGDLGQSDYLN